VNLSGEHVQVNAAQCSHARKGLRHASHIE